MLTSTFLHAPGIGAGTERKLWDAGIADWNAVLSAPSLPLSARLRDSLLPIAETSVDALARRDSRWFAHAIPNREHWRAVESFKDGIAYVDIETNGGYGPNDITVIGVYDGFESRTYVAGIDLHEFERDAERFELLVTFFGTGFDLPFLRRRFPRLPLDQLHVDLCPALRRLGYSGGLKKIESQLGVRRVDEVEGMSGMDAVRLWDAWRYKKRRDALDLLLAYNRADIENLELLLNWSLPRLGELARAEPLKGTAR